VVGLYFILYPREVQRSAEQNARWWPNNWRTFSSYVRSPAYATQARVIGIVLILMSAVVMYRAWLGR
jgi:hypothetical protein